MTIRVEREALLMVINTSSSSTITTSPPYSSSSYNPCIRDNDDEFVIVDSVPTIKKGQNDFFYSDLMYTRDDDQASLCTISTISDSTFDSTSDNSTIVDRRVSFTPQLVTDIWTRPRTVPEDVSNLFYSAQETQKFRQEYRLERKLISELSIDPETFPVDDEELSNLVTATNATSPISSGNNGRHRISRVVVMHDDKLKTFFNPADQFILLDNNKEEEKHQQHSAYSQQATSCTSGGGGDDSDSSSSSEDFFDNDSFWSGSLTWY